MIKEICTENEASDIVIGLLKTSGDLGELVDDIKRLPESWRKHWTAGSF